MGDRKNNKSILNRSLLYIVNVTIILFAFMALIITTFNLIYINTSVKGYSMLPTLNSTVPSAIKEGDQVYVNRFYLGTRNDIIVAQVNIDGEKNTVVKRLIAIEGDKVCILKDGQFIYLYVNGQLINKKDAESAAQNMYDAFADYKAAHEERFDADNLLLLKDEIFIMGDNWEISKDSTHYGPIDKSCIIGRVDFVIDYQKNIYSTIIYKIINMFKI